MKNFKRSIYRLFEEEATTTTTIVNNTYLVRNVENLQEVIVVSNIGQLTIGYFVTLLGAGYTGCWEVISSTTGPTVTSVVSEFSEATCGGLITTTTTTPPAYTFSNGSILTKTSSSGTVTETLTGTLTVNSGPITLGARVNVGTGYQGYVNFTVDGVNSSIVSRQGQGISNGNTFSIPVGVYTYSLRVDASSDGTYTVVTGDVV